MSSALKAEVTVDPQEIALFSRYAHEWWDETGNFAPLHKINPTRIAFLRESILAHCPSFAGLNIVDIGCGGGLVCEPLARLGANVTGIDAAEKNIAVAKNHAEGMGLAIDYRNIAAETLAEEKKQFDVVLALEIIEHVADVEAFMQAISTLVKPGGLLIMSTLNRTHKAYALAIVGAEYIMRWLPRGTHDWKKFLRPSEVAALMEANGLKLTGQRGLSYKPFSREWFLSDDLSVNYFQTAIKEKIT